MTEFSKNQPVFYHFFYMNGTSDDLWPVNLTSAHIGDLSSIQAQSDYGCTLVTSIDNVRCISMGYLKILSFFSSVPDFVQWDRTWLVREPRFSRILGGAEAVGFVSPETWVFAPHAATAYWQSELWWDRAWFQR